MHAWLIMHQNYFYFLFFFNSKQTGEINLRQLCCHPQILDKDYNSDLYDEVDNNIGLSLEDVRINLIKYYEKEMNRNEIKLNAAKSLEKVIFENKVD